MRRIFISLIAAMTMLLAPVAAVAQNANAIASTDLIRITRVDPGGSGTLGAVGVLKAFDGVGIGYSSGAAVTQATSRATGVTINSYAGAITMFNAAGSATAASFTVTNSKVAATDTVNVSVRSATNAYVVVVTAVAAGSFQVTYFTTGGTAADAPVINYAVVRSAAS